jgi:hypothetical protein
LKQLRSGGQLAIDGGQGLYRVLVQLEALQSMEDLTPEEVAEFRRYIRELLARGMALRPEDTKRLSRMHRAHRPAQLPPNPRTHHHSMVSGPRLVDPHAATRKRLTTAEWARRHREIKAAPVPTRLIQSGEGANLVARRAAKL